MTERVFLDTNILVYAYDHDAPEAKRLRAREILTKALRLGDAVVSTQVLSEFHVTVTRKFASPLDLASAAEVIRHLSRLQVLGIDAALVLRAIDCQQRHGISFWDAQILAAAERAGCRQVLSEDLNHGQGYFDLRVINPFIDRPDPGSG